MPYRLATPQYRYFAIVKTPTAFNYGRTNFKWGGGWDSNPRSSEPQSDALGQLRYIHHIPAAQQVKLPLARREGLEPPALCLEGRCSIQLS